MPTRCTSADGMMHECSRMSLMSLGVPPIHGPNRRVPSPTDLFLTLPDTNVIFTTVKPRPDDVAFHGKNAKPSVQGSG